MRIGLFGGSFNPVHLGHIAVARAALDRLGLDKVVFIPSRHPPLKGAEGLMPADLRLALVRAALTDEPAMECNAIEIEREGPSFTVDTVEALLPTFPAGAELYFLLGADCLARLPRWKGIERLHALLRFAIFPRGGEAGQAAADPRLVHVPMPESPLSSTLVRARLAEGAAIGDIVPAPVAALLADRWPPLGAAPPAGDLIPS
ncbi:nicotinate (nicotinamide) nucleotide adenylyltransferase [Novosphingobium olei]|uniref:nicotinate (nicotinamide) nucleotide adenylyltransferase n=1 Tax=Novosphingobium olei TaxID=2728851 RepID=UPI00308A1A97|nr:nicotinate-nucleotide adenylyltransferase [Novosphingobium olei]